MTDSGLCRACGVPMLWCEMFEPVFGPDEWTFERKVKNGGPVRNPLDVGQLAPASVLPATHAVAYQPRNGHGIMVTTALVALVEEWAAAGVTFHLSHFATCPERGRFKR